MARKCVVRVGFCDECPHFDNSYYQFAAECPKLGSRRIPSNVDYQHPIPDDCPLPNFSDDWDDET